MIQRITGRCALRLGSDMGRHKRIARACHAGHQHFGRHGGEDATLSGMGRGAPTIGDKHFGRAARQHRGSGLRGSFEPGLTEKPGLFEVHVKRGMRTGEKRQQRRAMLALKLSENPDARGLLTDYFKRHPDADLRREVLP